MDSKIGEGKYLKAVDGRFFGAQVRLEFKAAQNEELHIECAPSLFSEMGDEVNTEAPGFVAWRRGAETGVRLGAELAHIPSGAAKILSIAGTYVDTTERAVAGAAALALWNAHGFDPGPDARQRLDAFVLNDDDARRR